MLRKNLINLSADLIKIKSESHNQQKIKEVIDYAFYYLKENDVKLNKYNYNNKPSLVATLRAEKNPKLFFVGHLDVVPAAEKEYTPRIEKNRLYGRGAGDMKVACAVMMAVFKFFSCLEKKPSLGLMLTTDEEVGGFDGACYLLNQEKYQAEMAVIPDGHKNLTCLTTDEKGVLQLKITTDGKAAHGSRPFLGENAIEKLYNIFLKIKKIIPDIEESNWENSLNLGKISGGQAANVVPDQAEMLLDIRYTKAENKDLILNEIKKITPNFTILAEGSPYIQDPNNFYVKQYIKTTEEIIKQKVNCIKSEGASDARFFCENKIPSISTKIKSGNIHSQNEWVCLKEMEDFYKILIKYVETID